MEKEPKQKKNPSNGNPFLKYWNAFVEAFLHDQKKIAKYIISFAAILHLLLSSIQITAISKLSNEICGITMFMFILLGFVCLFNAIRLKEPKGKNIVFSIIMLLVVMVAGGFLLNFYFDGLAHQKNIASQPVIKGVIVSFVILALYLFGLVETIVACIYYHKTSKKKKKEIEAA